MLATGQGGDRKDAHIWDTRTGKLIRDIPLPEENWHFGTRGDNYRVVKFSPDGKTLFTPNGLLVDVATGKLVLAKRIGVGHIYCAAFSLDGKCIAIADSARQARVHDVATGKPLGPAVPWEGAVALSLDDKTLLAGAEGPAAQLWDVATGKPEGPLLKSFFDERRWSPPYEFRAVALSPDGTLILTAMVDGTVQLWDAASGTPIGLPLPHRLDATDVAFSPDGKSFLTSCWWDKTARLWDVPDRHSAEMLLPHTNVYHIAFSPDGKLLATASVIRGVFKPPPKFSGQFNDMMGQVHFWDTVTGKQLGVLPLGEGEIYKMAFSPDSTTLAAFTGYGDLQRGAGGLVHIIDVQARKTVGPPLECKQYQIENLAFGPDGKTLTTTDILHLGPGDKSNEGKRAVKTWDLATRTVIHQTVTETLHGFFSPDRKYKFEGGEDFTFIVTGPGKEKRQVQIPEGLNNVAFRPNSTFLLTGHPHHAARIWHMPTLKPIGPFIKHHQVNAVAFSPDGQTIATGSTDGTVRLAPMPAPVEGDPERIGLWLQALTGAHLDGVQLRVLKGDEWLERLDQLEKLGGPPAR